jgi:hypothetical protein
VIATGDHSLNPHHFVGRASVRSWLSENASVRRERVRQDGTFEVGVALSQTGEVTLHDVVPPSDGEAISGEVKQ